MLRCCKRLALQRAHTGICRAASRAHVQPRLLPLAAHDAGASSSSRACECWRSVPAAIRARQRTRPPARPGKRSQRRRCRCLGVDGMDGVDATISTSCVR